MFSSINKDIIGGIEQRQWDGNAEIPECAVIIGFNTTDSTVIKKVLSLCRKISEQQPVTDWFLERVRCETLTEAEAPILFSNVQLGKPFAL